MPACAISRGDLDVVLVTGAEAMYARALARRDPTRPWLEWASQPEGTPPPVLFGVDKAGRHRARDAARRASSRPRLPLVRERAARRQRLDARRARRPHRRRCGPASARWPPAIPTPGSARPHAPTRSSRPARATGWSRSPIPSCARPTCRSTRARRPSCARWRRPAPPGCPRSAGSSRSPAPTATTTGSSRSGPSCTAPPPSGSPARPPSSRPGSASTTSPSSTSTRASPSWCRWPPRELGLAVDDPDRPLTLTGGLTFGGGPGNNYTSHGIARAVGALRAAPGTAALVTGLGWYATKHSLGVYASARRPTAARGPSPGATSSPQVDALPQCAIDPEATGPVRVETYTVTFDREGRPSAASSPAARPTAAGPGATSPTPTPWRSSAPRRASAARACSRSTAPLTLDE